MNINEGHNVRVEEITEVSYLWTLGMNSLKTIITAVGLESDG